MTSHFLNHKLIGKLRCRSSVWRRFYNVCNLTLIDSFVQQQLCWTFVPVLIRNHQKQVFFFFKRGKTRNLSSTWAVVAMKSLTYPRGCPCCLFLGELFYPEYLWGSKLFLHVGKTNILRLLHSGTFQQFRLMHNICEPFFTYKSEIFLNGNIEKMRQIWSWNS